MRNLPETNDNRIHLRTLGNGLKIYKVKLKGGKCDGAWTVASHDVAFCQGQEYRRGENNLYVHQPEAGGKN
jgi:hypothetical protein